MAINVTIDTAVKEIIVNSGVTEVDTQIDLYSDIKEDWLASSTLRKLRFPFIISGGDNIGAGQKSPTFYFLRFPWKVRTNGDGVLTIFALNLYAFNETENDVRDPFNTLPGDSVQNNVSNIPGFSGEEKAAIQHGAFGDAINIDVIDGTAGIKYPIGTQRVPSNNVPDSILIDSDRKFFALNIRGDYDFVSGDVISGYVITGGGVVRSYLTFADAVLANKCIVREATITGVLDGDSQIEQCIVENMLYLNGHIHNSTLQEGKTIILGGTTVAVFEDCGSLVAGTDTPLIDFGGSGQSLIFHRYSGGIKLINKTGPESASLGLIGGQVKIDLTTVTNGTIVVRGDGKVIDLSGNNLVTGTYGGLTILNETTPSKEEITEQVWNDPKALSVGKYETL